MRVPECGDRPHHTLLFPTFRPYMTVNAAASPPNPVDLSDPSRPHLGAARMPRCGLVL